MTHRTPLPSRFARTALPLLLLGSITLTACSLPERFQRTATAPAPTSVAPPTAPSSATLSQAQPESASGLTSKPGWTLNREAVAAATPLATQAPTS